MALRKIPPSGTHYFTGTKRNLTPIFDSLGYIRQWACSHCDWKSQPLEDLSSASTAATLKKYQGHFCKEFKKAV
jgi:hypothetical protein